MPSIRDDIAEDVVKIITFLEEKLGPRTKNMVSSTVVLGAATFAAGTALGTGMASEEQFLAICKDAWTLANQIHGG